MQFINKFQREAGDGGGAPLQDTNKGLIRTRLELIEYKKHLAEVLNDGSNLFEKQLSYISAGALALSFVVVEKVVDISKSEFKPLLIAGWSLLAFTLLLNLISHQIGNWVHSSNMRYIDDCISDNKKLEQYDYKKIDKRKMLIHVINIGTIFTLILGIIMIIWFTSINILNTNVQEEQSSSKANSKLFLNPNKAEQNGKVNKEYYYKT